MFLDIFLDKKMHIVAHVHKSGILLVISTPDQITHRLQTMKIGCNDFSRFNRVANDYRRVTTKLI